jgi:hypothetical protein
MAGPVGWPEAVVPIFQHAVTVEYTSLTRAGTPIMVPVTPYLEPEARTLDISTGLTYPAKAERARRNPKVCLLFADQVGAGLSDAPVVLVQGLATVRDADLQANTDRYVRLALAKAPEMFRGQPRFLLRRLDWYFARIWIQVTPIRIWWWQANAPDHVPGQWVAPPATTAPPSDLAPAGRPPSAWLQAPADWRATARSALARLDQRDLGWVGPDGFPLAVPLAEVDQVEQGFRLRIARHLPAAPQGPACLTLHAHPARFTRQENHTFLGEVANTGPDDYVFRVRRLLADVSLTGNKLASTLGFFAKGRRLAPRLAPEAARRSQPVPKVRHPHDHRPREPRRVRTRR